jgi:hypothetical protein
MTPPSAIVREIESQRTIAARSPHVMIGKQRRQTSAGPQQREIEKSGVTGAQQHANTVDGGADE